MNLIVEVAAVQEMHFTCTADSQGLENDYVVLLAFASRRDFSVKYVHQLNLDRTKVVKSVEYMLSRTVERGFPSSLIKLNGTLSARLASATRDT